MLELTGGEVTLEQKDLLGGNCGKILEKGDLACIWMVAVGIEKKKNVSEIARE